MPFIRIDVKSDQQSTPALKYPRYETAKMREKCHRANNCVQLEGKPIHSPRRMLRAFEQWLTETRDAFAITVIVRRRYVNKLECELVGINSAISVSVFPSDICISADLNGECWDLLNSFDTSPQKRNNSYFDSLTIPEFRTNYPSPEALWREDTFEPFLNWVNDKLAPSQWLAFYRIGGEGHSTWAEIGQGEPKESECLHTILPLRIEQTARL